ncbi:phospholipase [Massilia sp. CCM 8733]|uniref:phospholipase D n=1 Tax=Massilia mucilaginosa TaxID=2609282 RepID=A0ABX0NS25_9BURK|nr:phospholipase D-like domain-containing protein [Massilia mucilaginosa]NHZ89597.1 phospholipase [Massilia mucilaginosa]
MSNGNWSVVGKNATAPFTLKIHRGESMVLIAMNWRDGKPPIDFAGFAIEYRAPGSVKFKVLKNRLGFPGITADKSLSTLESPIQKFRWVHFPFQAELAGEFTYRVTPVFMDPDAVLRYGESQMASIELGLETYEGELNVAFTRGYVSSQKFSQTYLKDGHKIGSLLPATAADGLTFVATHPQAAKALGWMGFEARNAILGLLDEALADSDAQVSVVAYDLSERDVVTRLQALGPRLRIIIDNSADHGHPHSAENAAASMLANSAGEGNVIRQKMGGLQHNKTIVVNGPKCKAVVCGSTNFSWRGFFIQANNAVIMRGDEPVRVFENAFMAYWSPDDDVNRVRTSQSAGWSDLGLPSVQAAVTFSPHGSDNKVLDTVARYVGAHTKSNVLFALAFLYQTDGAMRDAISSLTDNENVFVYGMSDKKTGINLQMANGHMAIVQPAVLADDVPEPFAREIAGGGGIRLHHKFIVTDFNTPDARVYMGSFNFSEAADVKNGEQLVVIRDQRVATAYMVEALRIFDHYEYRVRRAAAKVKNKHLELRLPPRKESEKPWWLEDWTDPIKIRDRELFS